LSLFTPVRCKQPQPVQVRDQFRFNSRALTQSKRSPTRALSRGRRQWQLAVCSQDGLPAVLVTGASSGIGRAVALHLASSGWRVFGGVRREVDGALLKEEEQRIEPVIIDVANAESVAKAAALIRGLLGDDRGLQGLVNNAGVAMVAPLELIPEAEFAFVMDVNVLGPLRVTQCFLPLLKKAPRARIVNVGSQAGTLAYPGFGAYNCSKFALEAFSDTLRMEMKMFDISVSHLSPGAVKTPIWERSGKRSNDVMEAASTHEAAAQYQELNRQTLAAAGNAAVKGCSVQETNFAISHALSDPKPKTHYIIGRAANVMIRLRKLLGILSLDWVFDWLVLNALSKF